jgi:hypothetical protein
MKVLTPGRHDYVYIKLAINFIFSVNEMGKGCEESKNSLGINLKTRPFDAAVSCRGRTKDSREKAVDCAKLSNV